MTEHRPTEDVTDNVQDVVTFGESMVLLVADETGPLEGVAAFRKRLAGAESNVAIGLARMGHRVSWFSCVGDDPFGRYIVKTIRGEGVHVNNVVVRETHPTGVMFKERFELGDPSVYYYRAGSAASTIGPDDIDETWIAKARYLLVTGITPALSDTCHEAVFKAMRIARKAGVKVVLDPNIRFKLWSRDRAHEVLRALCELADIVLPGLEEGAFLTGQQRPEDIAKAIRALGASVVIVKTGAEGALFDDGSKSAHVGGFDIPRVVDPIGAGDAFAAGLLSGLLDGNPLADAVRRGNAMGALATTVIGDIEGLPRRAELEQFMRGERRLSR